tara:strand:- start:152 stop:358 length:207 start_codon:yes stop_codon:yes gene_type:complete
MLGDFVLSIKDEKLGVRIQEFILRPDRDTLFLIILLTLLILLISSGIFPKLLPNVNLNFGSSAFNKDA